MTLTQRTDGEPGASYLELVELLQSQGANAQKDCRELFRRVVFSILIHNTDDHLRNHGFLLGPEGITLSPAFDINPAIDRNELALRSTRWNPPAKWRSHWRHTDPTE